MADINEQICKAVDIIVSKKLESINFDSTIIATIVDNSEAEQYKYICSNGSSQFVAYAKETNYKINESVYVTIPNNDYDQQKIIIGKYVAKDAKPYIFKQPFETIIDISGNLIKTNEIIAQSLLANNENINEENYDEITLWQTTFPEGYAGFDRLGLQAQFRSWIASYETSIGDYGLKLYISSDMGTAINKENPLKITEIKFSSLDMYGNPYNFQSFMEQEAVYDISELGNIYKMQLVFYQTPKSFKDKNGNLIPYQTITKNRLLNNLFVKDPYICLGYNLSDFQDEQVIISTLDPKTYIIDDNISSADISKYIRLRWLHKFENGDIQVVNESSKLSDYDIRWYRYELGAPSADEYSGVYWESVDDGNGNQFDYTLIPRKKHDEELIKAIVIYDGKSYTSNILTFTNEREVINSATIDFLNGLSIVCEDNSYGNYCIYGQNNNLFDADQANRIRELQAYFGFSEQGQSSDKLQEATKIVWEFPLYNSMIILDGFDYYKLIPLDGYYTNNEISINKQQGLIQVTRYPDESGKINSKQDYRIQKTYNQTKVNNTIRCTITKNQIEYSASKDFTFGLMGTNGTDATVVIDFEDNKVALTADRDEALSLRAHLYDSTHKEIDLNNKDLNISCEWSWYKIKLNSGDNVQIKQRILYDADGKQSGEDTTIDVNKCFIEHLAFDELNNQFLILQAKIKGWGDYDLISYKAIPIRKNRQYRNYIGPTDIVYNSSGYADYYKQPFELWWCDNLADIGDNDNVVDKTLTIKAEDLQWKIGNPFNEQSQYLGTISNNILKPVYVFIKDSQPYSIICKQNNNIVWIQPLVIIQNQYPSTTINKWDGKEITMEGGVILTPAIAAGNKNKEDNTFSGVMIGAWGEKKTDTASDITEYTGIYGFHHGAMSYAFKEDGTGFIGKSGKGRINFNGDTGSIQSLSYSQAGTGMKIDLDDGFIDIRGSKVIDENKIDANSYAPSGSQVKISATSPYLKVVDENEKTILNVGTNNYYLQSSDFSSSSETGVKFDLGNGYITGYNFTIQGKSSKGNIIISSDNTNKPLRIGSRFSVDWDGSITAKNGSFENGDFSGYIHGSSIYGGYIWGSDIEGGTISGTEITGGEIHGAKIYFGQGTVYVYNGSNGSTIKLSVNKGQSFTVGKVTYTYDKTESALDAGSLLYSQGAYDLGDGQTAPSAILALESEGIGGNTALPIVIRSNERILIRSDAGWVGINSGGWSDARVSVHKTDGVGIAGKALTVTVPKDKQTGIYARFA